MTPLSEDRWGADLGECSMELMLPCLVPNREQYGPVIISPLSFPINSPELDEHHVVLNCP